MYEVKLSISCGKIDFFFFFFLRQKHNFYASIITVVYVRFSKPSTPYALIISIKMTLMFKDTTASFTNIFRWLNFAISSHVCLNAELKLLHVSDTQRSPLLSLHCSPRISAFIFVFGFFAPSFLCSVLFLCCIFRYQPSF